MKKLISILALLTIVTTVVWAAGGVPFTGSMESNDIDLSESISPYTNTNLQLFLVELAASMSTSGTGDVTSVGDCTTGACLDGSSDGGTYLRLYDGNSHYVQLAVPDVSANRTITMPNNTATLATIGLAETFTGAKTLTEDTNFIGDIVATAANNAFVIIHIVTN